MLCGELEEKPFNLGRERGEALDPLFNLYDRLESSIVLVEYKSSSQFEQCLAGSRRKVGAEKSLNCQKVELFSSRTFFLQFFFGSFGCRPFILKLVPNYEEWNDKITWFNWSWQRRFGNGLILKTIRNVPNI